MTRCKKCGQPVTTGLKADQMIIDEIYRVITCADCKYFATEDTTSISYCRLANGLYGNLKSTDFCSYAEKKAEV